MVRGVQIQEVDDLPGETRGRLVAQQVDERVDEEERERVETRDQESVDRDDLQLASLTSGDETPCVADSSYEPKMFLSQSDRPLFSRRLVPRYTR